MNPGNSDLYIVLGNFFFQMKKPAEAESAYLKAIDISPKEIKPYMVAAGFYDASGNADKTLAMYEKALALKPDDVNIMTIHGRLFSQAPTDGRRATISGQGA